MGFKDRTFNQPIYSEDKEDPKRIVIISCEGRNTEPEYFEAIKNKLGHHIPHLLEIDVVPKEDNNSEPKYVIDNLEKFIVDKYDYNGKHDQLWIVCDREKVDDRRKNLVDIIPLCEQKNYCIALTNPLFEFWLLLHVVDIKQYDAKLLFKNEWVNRGKKRRFIDKLLSEVLENGFNKKKGKFNTEIVSMENIERALKQEKDFANTRDEILDKLGSNVGDLIRAILPLS
jgi:hypothetical protein